MGLSQALSAALAGVNTTQQSLSVIAGNVANANTPGYVAQTINQVEVATAGQNGVSVDTSGINRNLNTLLQNQLWTETSGGSYADTTAQLYQQLQQLYGTPGSSTSFDAIYNNFTTAAQALSTSPGSYSAQAAVVGAAQALAQNLNSMTTSVQQLRTQAEQGIATDVQTANNALQQIAKINEQLQGTSTSDSAAATLEDQRDQDVTQLTQLMNVNVVQNANNQISVFTGTGQQLVAGIQASQLNFDNVGTLSATVAMEFQPEPGHRRHHHAGIAGRRHHRSDRQPTRSSPARSAPICKCATPSCRRRRISSTNWPTRCRRRCRTRRPAELRSSPAHSRDTASTSARCCRATRSRSLIPTLATSSTPSRWSRSVRAARCRCRLQPSNANDQTIGINFSGGMASVVSQLNAAFGSNLQFSNPSGTVLQVLNNSGSGNVVNALSATSTATSLTSGSPQLPLFLDGTAADHRRDQRRRLADYGSRRPHRGQFGRGRVALEPGGLRAGHRLGRPDAAGFHSQPADQRVAELIRRRPASAARPSRISGTLSNYMSQIISQQSQAANAATNLQQGQDTVVSALQQRFNDKSGVNIDTEMSNLIALQNAYGANARVMTTIQQMMATLLQVVP